MAETQQPRPALRAERLALLVGAAWLISYSLAPFEFDFVPSELKNRVQEALVPDFKDGFFKPAGHFVAFLLLGLLVAIAHGRELAGRRFGNVVLVTFGACVGLEVLQLFQPERHARAVDLVLNFSGLMLGLGMLIRFRNRAGCMAAQDFCLRHSGRLQIAVMILAMLWWFGAGLRPALGSLGMDWDRDFPLLIANELDGSRPWLGEIAFARVYGRAFTADEVSARHKRLLPVGDATVERDLEMLAGYDFRQRWADVVVPEGGVASDELSLSVPAHCKWSEQGGVVLTEPSLLVTTGSAAALADAIGASGAFSLEAWVRPQNLTQTGPARIMSVSASIVERNFTLGQSGADLVFRVRNQLTGTNGTVQALQAANVMEPGWQHLVAVYDHGVSALFRDGRRVGTVLDLRDPMFHLQLGTGTAGRVMSAMLMSIGVAIPAVASFRKFTRGWRSHAAGFLFVLGVGVLPYLVTRLMFGGPLLLNPIVSLAVGLMVAFLTAYPLAWCYTTTSRAIQRAASKTVRQPEQGCRAALGHYPGA